MRAQLLAQLRQLSLLAFDRRRQPAVVVPGALQLGGQFVEHLRAGRRTANGVEIGLQRADDLASRVALLAETVSLLLRLPRRASRGIHLALGRVRHLTPTRLLAVHRQPGGADQIAFPVADGAE